MKRFALLGVGTAVAIAACFALAGRRLGDGVPRSGTPAPETSAPRLAEPPSTTTAPGAGGSARNAQGYLYGRVTTRTGAVYLGRLRWAGNDEAFWSDSFNGLKAENPWAAQVPPERLPKEDRSVSILGLHFGDSAHPKDLRRLFMARFGDLARIEARGAKVVRVTVKSGTAFDLDRFEAGDFDDGVRVWDARGPVDLDSLAIASVELLPTTGLADAPARLSGTVHTAQGDFTGYLQWDRSKGVATDELVGRRKIGVPGLETAVLPGLKAGIISLRFETIRTIARRDPNGALVTLLDGRKVELIGTGDSGVGDVGIDNRGIYVDDPRYGRVLVAWKAFESADLRPADSGPAYSDFSAGSAIAGTVVTNDGRRLRGRLVFDLDETETTDTLDAPAGGVNYLLPFGLVASIEPAPPALSAARATVRLWSGEELALEPSGDLGESNAGLLIFAGGAQPEYVAWSEVARIDLERPAAQVHP